MIDTLQGNTNTEVHVWVQNPFAEVASRPSDLLNRDRAGDYVTGSNNCEYRSFLACILQVTAGSESLAGVLGCWRACQNVPEPVSC